MFAGFDPSQRLNILDLGSAEPESVAFYNRYDAKICIINMIDDWTTGRPSNLFDLMPDGAKGLCFDICLLWDTLNYLHADAMRDVAQDIAGYLHEGSRIHAIAAYAPTWAFDAYRYGIDDHDRIVAKSRSQTVPHPHSQIEIEKALPGFRIQHTLLRPGNRLELLLARNKNSQPSAAG